MNAIEIKNLVKTYRTGTKALKGVDLSVPEGDFFALLGANGAGKTTIIGVLTGLVTKSDGKVQIFGHSIDDDFEAAKKCIGVVPQEFNFNMFEQVQDIVVNQAGYFGIDYKIAFKDSEEILKRVGLWEKRKSMARTLSGGMKRRLMIARGLIHRPRMLILDEPTAGVDVELRHGMWKYLSEINAQGTTILLTTHYLEEVEQMCRNCAIIKEGEIVRLDSVRNLLMTIPQDTYRVTVKEMLSLEGVRSFNPVKIDEHTLDIEIQKREELNELILKLAQSGFVITDFHPKGNRLEKLFFGDTSKVIKHDQYIALKTIVRKETNRIMRIWSQTLLPPLITQTLYFVIFGKFIGSQVRSINGISYMEFIVPGLVMMAVISNAYGNVVASFYGAKFQRNIEEILVSPTPNWIIIAGYVLGGVVRGIAVGFLVFLVSLFFAHPIVTHWWAVILFTFLSSVVFSLAALINGLFARNFDEVAFFQNFILTPLIYLGGVFYSIHSLPQVWQRISLYNPLVYMVNGFRYGFFGFSDVNPWVCLMILVVLTIILGVVNLILFKKGIGLKN